MLASTGAGTTTGNAGAASTFYAGAIICLVTLIGMRVMPSAYRQGLKTAWGQTSCFTVRGESPERVLSTFAHSRRQARAYAENAYSSASYRWDAVAD